MHSISGTLRLNSISFKKIIHFDMLVIDWWYQSKITPIPLVHHKYNERLHCGRYWYIPSTVKSNLHLIKIEKAEQVFMQHSSHYVAQLYNGLFSESIILQPCESKKCWKCCWNKGWRCVSKLFPRPLVTKIVIVSFPASDAPAWTGY